MQTVGEQFRFARLRRDLSLAQVAERATCSLTDGLRHCEVSLRGRFCNEGEAIYFLMNEEKAKEMGFLHCEVEE